MNSYDVTDLVIVHIISLDAITQLYGCTFTYRVLTSPMKKIDWYTYSVVQLYKYLLVLAYILSKVSHGYVYKA